MKALVTGGLGFIGSHLVDRLLKDGWDVVVLDNLLTADASNLKHQNRNPNLKIVKGDIRNIDTLKKTSKGCDTVFHMAAHALMRESLNDHKLDLDYNLVGTLNVLDAMVSNGIPDLVFASTSAIYGEAKVIPTPEDYVGIQTSLYGASKLGCEAFAQAFLELAPMRFWAYRFGTVVGERCRRGAIWDFIRKLKENPKRLEILGNGKQRKDYLYVKDCIDGIILGYENSSDRLNIFNLGLQQQTTVDRLADIVIEEVGLPEVKKEYAGERTGWIGDNPIVHLSIERIRKVGWNPVFSAEEAIRLTTRWTLKELGSNREKMASHKSQELKE